MKSLLLAFVAVIALAGCSSSSGTPGAALPTTSSGTSASTTTPVVAVSPTAAPVAMTAQQVAASFGCTGYAVKPTTGAVVGPVPTSQGTCTLQGTGYTVVAYMTASDVTVALSLITGTLPSMISAPMTVASGTHYLISRTAFDTQLAGPMIAAVTAAGGVITTITPKAAG